MRPVPATIGRYQISAVLSALREAGFVDQHENAVQIHLLCDKQLLLNHGPVVLVTKALNLLFSEPHTAVAAFKPIEALVFEPVRICEED